MRQAAGIMLIIFGMFLLIGFISTIAALVFLSMTLFLTYSSLLSLYFLLLVGSFSSRENTGGYA